MSQPSARPSQFMRLLAALAYPVWIIAVLILLTDLKTDPFMRRHGWTALYWWGALVIVYVGIFFIGLFPFQQWVFVFSPLLFPAFLVLSIYYAVQTYNERTFSIPIVSEWAQKHVF